MVIWHRGIRSCRDLASYVREVCALVATAVAILPSATAAQTAPFEIELEGGPVWQSYNDVEIPNDGTATRFSLSDVVGTGPWLAGRLYLTWNVAERHGLRLLLAPLSVTETSVLGSAVDFAGASYVGGVPVEATYQFNSYRLTYRWRFHQGDRSRAWVGFTAKIRDAQIALTQGATASRKDDLGFVPLLHLAGDLRLGQGWYLSLDADALAGGPGRAIDAALRIGYDIDANWSIRAGYRTVEGGADVEEVYNFAWLHYGAVSIVWRP